VCEHQRQLPLAMIESLTAGDHHRLQNLFTRFMVCTKGRLLELVEKIQRAAKEALQSRRELH
jgi:hypothetical protein